MCSSLLENTIKETIFFIYVYKEYVMMNSQGQMISIRFVIYFFLYITYLTKVKSKWGLTSYINWLKVNLAFLLPAFVCERVCVCVCLWLEKIKTHYFWFEYMLVLHSKL